MSALRPEDPTSVGRWQLVSRLGEGGMGTVYVAERNGERAAIKVIRTDLVAVEEAAQRFQRELAASLKVDSPRVAPILDFDFMGEVPFIASRYYDAPDLSAWVEDHEPMHGESLASFSTGLAEGIEAIHKANVVHRDLKPSNILITSDGPVIIDFGIAAVTDQATLTQAGQVIGSPGWISPEQLDGQPVTAAADLYGWASVVQFAATGRTPAGEGSYFDLAFRIQKGDLLPHGIPGPLGKQVSAALRIEPDDRPGIGDVIAGSPMPRFRKGTQAKWLAAAAVAVVALAGGSGFILARDNEPGQTVVAEADSAAQSDPTAAQPDPAPQSDPTAAQPDPAPSPDPAPTPELAQPVSVVAANPLPAYGDYASGSFAGLLTGLEAAPGATNVRDHILAFDPGFPADAPIADGSVLIGMSAVEALTFEEDPFATSTVSYVSGAPADELAAWSRAEAQSQGYDYADSTVRVDGRDCRFSSTEVFERSGESLVVSVCAVALGDVWVSVVELEREWTPSGRFRTNAGLAAASAPRPLGTQLSTYRIELEPRSDDFIGPGAAADYGLSVSLGFVSEASGEDRDALEGRFADESGGWVVPESDDEVLPDIRWAESGSHAWSPSVFATGSGFSVTIRTDFEGIDLTPAVFEIPEPYGDDAVAQMVDLPIRNDSTILPADYGEREALPIGNTATPAQVVESIDAAIGATNVVAHLAALGIPVPPELPLPDEGALLFVDLTQTADRASWEIRVAVETSPADTLGWALDALAESGVPAFDPVSVPQAWEPLDGRFGYFPSLDTFSPEAPEWAAGLSLSISHIEAFTWVTYTGTTDIDDFDPRDRTASTFSSDFPLPEGAEPFAFALGGQAVEAEITVQGYFDFDRNGATAWLAHTWSGPSGLDGLNEFEIAAETERQRVEIASQFPVGAWGSQATLGVDDVNFDVPLLELDHPDFDLAHALIVADNPNNRGMRWIRLTGLVFADG